MSEIKFSCPSCQQHISADSGYAGAAIACPACASQMIVPGTPVQASVPAPIPLQTQTTYAPPPPPPQPSASGGCPSCGAALPRGAVLCTVCGYNLATKQRIVAGRVVAPGKPVQQADENEPWYKTPYPYLLVITGIFALLYYLGRSNPAMMLALIGFAVLYSLTVHICVAVAAFQTSVGTGFLTLCVPFYAIRFVFNECESDWLKAFYSFAIIVNIALRVVNAILN